MLSRSVCSWSGWRSGGHLHAAWAGYTFENICLTHVQWIQKALRLDHISFEVGSWCFVPTVGHADRSGAQIDLLFDRDDQVISLCEIKYNAESFSIDKECLTPP